MKDVAYFALGLCFGAICFFLPTLPAAWVLPPMAVSGLVAVTSLFGSLLSFYFAFRIVRQKSPQLLSSTVVYLAFVIPIFGLTVARYLETGNYSFLGLGIAMLAVLTLEARSIISVGGNGNYVHAKIRRILLGENLYFREVGSDFYLEEGEMAVRESFAGVTVGGGLVRKRQVFGKIAETLARELPREPVPLIFLHYRRYVLWGSILLLLAALTAAEKPWW